MIDSQTSAEHRLMKRIKFELTLLGSSLQQQHTRTRQYENIHKFTGTLVETH